MVYHDDTSQLCRTGHDDASHTGMPTLACILSELFPLDYFSGNALYLNTVRIIFMIFVEEVMTMCSVYKVWQLSCSHLP